MTVIDNEQTGLTIIDVTEWSPEQIYAVCLYQGLSIPVVSDLPECPIMSETFYEDCAAVGLMPMNEYLSDINWNTINPYKEDSSDNILTWQDKDTYPLFRQSSMSDVRYLDKSHANLRWKDLGNPSNRAYYEYRYESESIFKDLKTFNTIIVYVLSGNSTSVASYGYFDISIEFERVASIVVDLSVTREGSATEFSRSLYLVYYNHALDAESSLTKVHPNLTGKITTRRVTNRLLDNYLSTRKKLLYGENFIIESENAKLNYKDREDTLYKYYLPKFSEVEDIYDTFKESIDLPDLNTFKSQSILTTDRMCGLFLGFYGDRLNYNMNILQDGTLSYIKSTPKKQIGDGSGVYTESSDSSLSGSITIDESEGTFIVNTETLTITIDGIQYIYHRISQIENTEHLIIGTWLRFSPGYIIMIPSGFNNTGVAYKINGDLFNNSIFVPTIKIYNRAILVQTANKSYLMKPSGNVTDIPINNRNVILYNNSYEPEPRTDITVLPIFDLGNMVYYNDHASFKNLYSEKVYPMTGFKALVDLRYGQDGSDTLNHLESEYNIEASLYDFVKNANRDFNCYDTGVILENNNTITVFEYFPQVGITTRYEYPKLSNAIKYYLDNRTLYAIVEDNGSLYIYGAALYDTVTKMKELEEFNEGIVIYHRGIQLTI